MSAWILEYSGFDPAREGLREALCTLGNGCLATRGAAPEARADGAHYPGTYVAGVYNRLATAVAGRTLENESIVNLPNWLPLTFRVEDGVLAGQRPRSSSTGSSSTCAGACSPGSRGSATTQVA